MESFLWTTAAALVAGLATVAWTAPRLYRLLPQWIVKSIFFVVVGGFFLWDYAIRFHNEKIRDAFPDNALDILAISQSSQVPAFWWGVCFFCFIYLGLLYIVAELKIHHDENLQTPKG